MKENRFAVKAMRALVIVLGLVLAGLTAVAMKYQIVDGKLYERSALTLDLRGENVDPDHYQKLKEALPDSQIRWDVVFQGQKIPDDTQKVTVETLSDQDVLVLASLPELKTVSARKCRDYEQLAALREKLPWVKVEITVELAGGSFDSGAIEIRLKGFAQEDLERLPLLTKLKTVVLQAAEDQPDYTALLEYCQSRDIDVVLELAGEKIARTAKSLTLTGVQEEELYLLDYLPQLTRLHLEAPEAEADSVWALEDKYPQMKITWEVDIFGVRIDRDQVPEEIDLSEARITDLEKVEKALALLPDVQAVFLGRQNIDNEEIAQYRERVRDDYKVVWTVTFGTWSSEAKTRKQSVRTDITYFFPAKAGVGIEFYDDPDIKDPKDCMTWNLRYCEDVIAVDVGHLGVRHTDWLEGMPKLKYLILAHTQVQDVEGIQNCKELLFLELDWSCIRDLSPLVECTSLEDLNIGKTWPDVTPLLEMPWLKNVYMILGSSGDAYKVSQALPDTRVVASGQYTVASGWRKLPNYYDMRDALETYYMDG